MAGASRKPRKPAIKIKPNSSSVTCRVYTEASEISI
jgi:hypothetical protein